MTTVGKLTGQRGHVIRYALTDRTIRLTAEHFIAPDVSPHAPAALRRMVAAADDDMHAAAAGLLDRGQRAELLTLHRPGRRTVAEYLIRKEK